MNHEIISKFMNAVNLLQKQGQGLNNIEDLSKGEFLMLRMIESCGRVGNSVTSSFLSRELGVSKSAISQMINILLKKEYICRYLDETDHRIFTIELSPQGKAKLNTAEQSVQQKIGFVLDELGEEDTLQFVFLLEKLSAALAQCTNIKKE